MSAEEYVELAFEASSLNVNDDEDDGGETLTRARAYDTKHVQHSKAARHHLVQLEGASDIEQQRGLSRRLKSLRRNRYFLDDRLESVTAVKGRKRKKKRWRLDTSCWAPRKESGNSLDFFESSDAIRKLFDVDWGIAAKAHNLSMFILKSQRDPSEWRSIDKAAAHDHGEVEEVREELWKYHRLIYGVYDYYSCLYTDDGLGHEEPDVFNITFASYMNFVEHNQMISKKKPAGPFEVIWSIVNAKDKALTEEEDKHNKDKALNRQEFIQSLVRCAVEVYITQGNMCDVSDCVNRLMVENLTACMSKRCPTALQSSNAFRARFCYIEATSLVLEANLKSLRALYESYAEVCKGDALSSDALMSVGEFLHFVRHMGLMDSKQITAAQAKAIFLWSRIRSADGVSDKQEARLRHLFFEDFLEALVRMATMMAFPTQIEIEEVGAQNAGEYLLGLQADDPAMYEEFLQTHRPRHRDADGSDFDADGTGLKGLFQPVWLTIKHLIDLLVRTVEHNTSAIKNDDAADGVIQAGEAAKFIRMRSEGKGLAVKSTLQGADWRLAQDKAIFTAAAIKIQLMSRARKAKRNIEARRKRNQQVANAIDEGREVQLDDR